MTRKAAPTLPSGARGGPRRAIRRAHGAPAEVPGLPRTRDGSFEPELSWAAGSPGTPADWRRWDCPAETRARARCRPHWGRLQSRRKTPGEALRNNRETSSRGSAGGSQPAPHSPPARSASSSLTAVPHAPQLKRRGNLPPAAPANHRQPSTRRPPPLPISARDTGGGGTAPAHPRLQAFRGGVRAVRGCSDRRRRQGAASWGRERGPSPQ